MSLTPIQGSAITYAIFALGIAEADVSSFHGAGGLDEEGVLDWVVEYEAVVRECLSPDANAHGKSKARMGSGVRRNLRKSRRRIGRGGERRNRHRKESVDRSHSHRDDGLGG